MFEWRPSLLCFASILYFIKYVYFLPNSARNKWQIRRTNNVNSKSITTTVGNATNLQRRPLGDVSNVDMHSQMGSCMLPRIICALRITTLSYVFHFLFEHVYLLFISAQACSTSLMEPAWKLWCMDRQIPTHPLMAMSLMLIRQPRWVEVRLHTYHANTQYELQIWSVFHIKEATYLPCFDSLF